MSCSGTGKITKKKIAVFSSMGVAIAVGTYFVFTTTNNPAIAAAVPAVLAVGACPIMCAVMGCVMWLSRRTGKNRNKEDQRFSLKERPSTKPILFSFML